jgi:clan AA aspartic protease (TIGR02281 family)
MSSPNVLFHDARPRWRMPGLASLCVVGLASVAVATLTQPMPVTRPPAPAIERHPEFRLSADEYGQFWVSGTVNGVNGAVSARFLIDTGASDTMITTHLAQQLGLRGLKFTAPHSTANGITHDARTHLKSLEVAGITVSDFPADVSGGKTDLCLLGMTWLKRFDVRVSDGVMVLTLKAEQ